MLQLIILIWVTLGIILIGEMNFMVKEQTTFAQVMFMIVLTIFAPAIYATRFAENIIYLIIPEQDEEEEDNDDG